MSRSRVILSILLLVLGVIGVKSAWPWLVGLEDAGASAGFGFAGIDETPVVERLAELRIADLEQKPGEFHPGRDPFRFAVKPPPPKPAPAPKPVVAPVKKKPAPKRVRPGRAKPPAPKPPEVDVKYLGSFGPDEGKIAVFADGIDIYNVRKGDILKEHFVVESINYESADLKFVNFPTLPPKRLAAGG